MKLNKLKIGDIVKIRCPKWPPNEEYYVKVISKINPDRHWKTVDCVIIFPDNYRGPFSIEEGDIIKKLTSKEIKFLKIKLL